MSYIAPTLFTGKPYSIPSSSSTNSASASSIASTVGTSAGLNASQTVAQLLLRSDAAANPDGTDPISLSTTAQNYLSHHVGVSDPNSTFVLSASQQQQLTSILQKYQHAPNTQATFNAIQTDLKTAGLSPDQLAAKDVKTGSTPGQEIAALLNGQTTDVPTFANEQTKATNYINQVYSQFQTILKNSSKAANASTTRTTA